MDVDGEPFTWPQTIMATESSWLNDAGDIIIEDIPTVPGA